MALASAPDRPQVKAFLADIREHPDDPTPRLILADWLEDNDDPRGTFLRVQCYRDFAVTAPAEIPPVHWIQESHELQQRYEVSWLGELRDYVENWHFQGGLLSVTMSAEVLPSAAKQNPDKSKGRLQNLRRSIRHFFQMLVDGTDGFTHDVLLSVVDTETWAWVERVQLTNINAASFAAVLDSPLLQSIHNLDLSYADINAECLDILTAAPLAKQLYSLGLSGNPLGIEGVRRLANSSSLSGLSLLDLSRIEMTAEGATALAASPHLRQLTSLNLTRTDIGSAGIIALARSPILARVKLLGLEGTALDDDAVAALVESPYLNEIRTLKVDSLEAIDPELAQAIRVRYGTNLVEVPCESDPDDDGTW